MAKNGKHHKIGAKFCSKLPKQEVEQFEHVPKPTPVVGVAEAKFPKEALASRSLISVAFRAIRPSWRSYILYVDMAARKGNTAMVRYRSVYESLTPRDRASVWPEQICDMAQISPDELVGAVCQHMWASKAAESSMVSSIAHPELLKRTIQFAMKEENFKDRELMFRAMGSLPDRKGTSINIFNQAAGQVNEAVDDLAVGHAKYRGFDEDIIETSRELDAPFIVKDDHVSP